MAQSEVIGREISCITALPYAAPSAFLADQRRLETLSPSLPLAQAQHRAMIEAIARREGVRAREHARAPPGAM